MASANYGCRTHVERVIINAVAGGALSGMRLLRADRSQLGRDSSRLLDKCRPPSPVCRDHLAARIQTVLHRGRCAAGRGVSAGLACIAASYKLTMHMEQLPGLMQRFGVALGQGVHSIKLASDSPCRLTECPQWISFRKRQSRLLRATLLAAKVPSGQAHLCQAVRN